MDPIRSNSITKSIISISSPGVHLVSGNHHGYARKVARQCNDFAEELVQRRPQKFGFWAALSLPDVEGSLEEISYVSNSQHASGFAVETNYHGIYLGDPLNKVFTELSRIKAKVFIHPTTPCVSLRSHCNGTGHDYTAITFLPHLPNP
jgi:hypothetical protein